MLPRSTDCVVPVTAPRPEDRASSRPRGTEDETARKSGVKLLVCPIFSIYLKTIVVPEAPKVESLMKILTELRVPQWNRVDAQPYMTAGDAIKTIDATEPLYRAPHQYESPSADEG